MFLSVHFMYSIIQNVFSFYALWVLHDRTKQTRPNGLRLGFTVKSDRFFQFRKPSGHRFGELTCREAFLVIPRRGVEVEVVRVKTQFRLSRNVAAAICCVFSSRRCRLGDRLCVGLLLFLGVSLGFCVNFMCVPRWSLAGCAKMVVG
jgi:hypothetical protein